MKKPDARSRSLVTWVLVILLLVAFAALLILVARPALADAPNPLFVAFKANPKTGQRMVMGAVTGPAAHGRSARARHTACRMRARSVNRSA